MCDLPQFSEPVRQPAQIKQSNAGVALELSAGLILLGHLCPTDFGKIEFAKKFGAA
jgi:hypothetical protein